MSETALATTVKPNELSTELKGFDALRIEVAQQVYAQKQLFVKAVSHGLETGRLIVEYAAQKDLKKEVDRINKENQAAGKGGRPIAYHCHVAELLSQSGVGVSKVWLEKCARAFVRSKELGFKVNNVNLLSCKSTETETVTHVPISGNVTLHTPKVDDTALFPSPIEDMLPAPDRVFPPAIVPPAEPPPKPTFKDFVKTFVAKLDGLADIAGEVGIRHKRNQEAIADAITLWFENQGVSIDIIFESKS